MVRFKSDEKRSHEVEDLVLERLASGALITELCREHDMPSISTLQSWRRTDPEFDDKCWSAEGQGCMVRGAMYIEEMREAISSGGPGSSSRVQGLRELMHDNARTAGKLVSRMNDRAELRMNGKAEGTAYVIGWASDIDTPCPKCGYEP